MKAYPKWLYHPSKPATVVDDEAAHKALGAGWVESPADVRPEQPAPPTPPKAEEKPTSLPKPKGR